MYMLTPVYMSSCMSKKYILSYTICNEDQTICQKPLISFAWLGMPRTKQQLIFFRSRYTPYARILILQPADIMDLKCQVNYISRSDFNYSHHSKNHAFNSYYNGRVFANGPGDQGSIPGRVIPKTKKMVLDAALLNTHRYKVCIKGKVEQSREWSSAFPYTLV